MERARLVKRGAAAQPAVKAPQTSLGASQGANAGQSVSEDVKARLAARGGQQQGAYAAWRALFGQGGAR